jgi:hypothetical protein
VDNELEVIRHQMEGKRASLAEKLGALEDEVVQTVHQATAAVSSTVQGVAEAVDTVKEKVEQTVETVKESLDFRDTIRQHPWTSLGVGFAAGFAGGMWLETPSLPRSFSRAEYPQTNGFPSESTTSSASTSSLGSAGAEVFQTLKGMAIGTLMGVLNKVVGDAIPASMKSDVDRMFEDITTRLGGKKLYRFDSSEEDRYPGGNPERMNV